MNIGMITTTSSPFDFELRIAAISDYLIEKGVIDLEEMNEFYTRARINRMRDLRVANQDAVKRARIVLPRKPLLGPDGNPI